ncbi:MAG: endonuclease/exonuclease/phosphatase family protein [Balneolaceae bacterium]
MNNQTSNHSTLEPAPLKITLLFATAVSFVLSLSLTDASAQSSDDSGEITVMSYNIRFDNPDDGVNAWPNRSHHVAEIMSENYDADIIGIQEALDHQINDLHQQLAEYSWVGVGRDDGKDTGEFSPIFFKKERFDLLSTNTFWLSETPQIPGSKSWDAAITRVATWAKLKDRATEQEFYILNTHFDHIGEQARVESSRMITNFISGLEDELPVIVTGDFNVPETSEAYAVIEESNALSDARYVSESDHQGPTASFSDWEQLREPESRIDYIFVNNHVSVHTHRILDDRVDGRFPSDHLPVLVELSLKHLSKN